jgi:predicted transcriptional regulator
MAKKPDYGTYKPEHVKHYGAARAIILGCIIKWCDFNKKNGNNLFDGYHWSGHITHEEFAEQTGLELKTVQRSLKWLLDCKIIVKGRYNKASYDRTGWYRPTGHYVPKPQDKLIPTTGQNVLTAMDKMSLTIPVNPFKSIKNPPINLILGEIDFIELNKEQVDALTPEQRVEYFYKKNEYIKLNKQIKI